MQLFENVILAQHCIEMEEITIGARTVCSVEFLVKLGVISVPS